MAWHIDWAGVLTGQPREWIISGFFTTVYVTLVGALFATLLTLLLMTLRLTGGRFGQRLVAVYVSIFRNTPLLVQLLFWYFAAYSALPESWRFYIADEHAWATFPGNIGWLTPEFLCSAWSLALFSAAFFVEEIQSGLNAVSAGQREAAWVQGFSQWQMLRYILLPQGIANAWQYLNLMKLSSLATGIGFAELTYQVSQIESYNAHALEAFAVGTALYLLLGLVMGGLFLLFSPTSPGKKRRKKMPMVSNQPGGHDVV